jgi:catechol 2,3-dioxygenase-like lactoylglutathione lyase family enzyme
MIIREVVRMSGTRAYFNQINVVSSDPVASVAFYRRLGVHIPDACVWRTGSGVHHVNAMNEGEDAPNFDIDSVPFAGIWNSGWKGRTDLAGRVVVGFEVSSRAAVDDVYVDLTGAGYRGLQPPYDAFWGSRYAMVEDPDGIAVGIMSPRSEEMRSETPDI